MRAALATVAVAALAAAGSAGANDYAGTVASGGAVSVAGTLIKCRVAAGVLGCVVFKGGKPNPAAWAFTIGDKEVQAGKVSANSPSYTSPREPAASGPRLQGSSKKLTVKVGQNFGAAGTHVACSILAVGGKTAVACVLVTPKGTAVPGSYGAVLTSHRIQVRTAQGAKSKVLFDRSF
jgi:hypothetical protein